MDKPEELHTVLKPIVQIELVVLVLYDSISIINVHDSGAGRYVAQQKFPASIICIDNLQLCCTKCRAERNIRLKILTE